MKHKRKKRYIFGFAFSRCSSVCGAFHQTNRAFGNFSRFSCTVRIFCRWCFIIDIVGGSMKFNFFKNCRNIQKYMCNSKIISFHSALILVIWRLLMLHAFNFACVQHWIQFYRKTFNCGICSTIPIIGT